MGDVILSFGCSPLPPPLGNEISAMEEGKTSPYSQVSTNQNGVVVFPTIAHKVIAEIVGTYVIVFMGCGSIVINSRYYMTIVGEAVVWGLAVMVMIYTLGHVSGGHFNSAVTIAFAASGRFPWKQVPAFVASQIAGSALAAVTLVVLFRQSIDIKFTVTQYKTPTTHLDAFVWEFIISFVLMLTICGVATDTRAINELSGVAVGAIVLINVIMAGNITGASMNPARSIGPALVVRDIECLWVYIVAPTLGTITACMIYSLLRHPMPQKK